MKKLDLYILEKLKIDKDVKAPVEYYTNSTIFWDKLYIEPERLDTIKKIVYGPNNYFKSLEETLEFINKLSEPHQKNISIWVNQWLRKMNLPKQKAKKILGISNKYNENYFNTFVIRFIAMVNEDIIKGR